MRNPFNARGPTDPKYYANREDLLEFFRKNIGAAAKSKVTKPDNIAILGEWGIGKTSSLYKFKDILYNEMGGEVNAFSAVKPIKPSCCVNADVFTTSLLDSLYAEYSVSTPILSKIKNVMAEEAKVWEKWKLKSLSFKPEIERKTKTYGAVNLSEALLNLWRKLNANGVEIAVIMLDDVQYLLLEGLGSSLFDLRTDIQSLSTQGVNYMFVITDLSFLYPEMHKLAEPFTRLFEKFELKPFDLKGTQELIKKPLDAEKISMSVSDEVVKRIHELTEGHPFFITLIMRDLLFKFDKGKITEKKFDEIYKEIIVHLAKTKFEDDLNKATDAEKKILFKVSKSKKSECSPSDVKASAKLFERLVEKNLLIKVARGKYRVSHSLFQEYLRERIHYQNKDVSKS